MAPSFVPDDYVIPLHLAGPGFRLEPLGPHHNDADHRAWTTSIEHIRATPGFSTRRWPPAGGMSLEENLRDLRAHAEDFRRRVGFTYTVLDDEDVVVGCVYIYPRGQIPTSPRCGRGSAQIGRNWTPCCTKPSTVGSPPTGRSPTSDTARASSHAHNRFCTWAPDDLSDRNGDGQQ
jgi:hypothetical protein